MKIGCARPCLAVAPPHYRKILHMPCIPMRRPVVDAAPLPRPRDAVMRAMIAIAEEIGAPIDIDHGVLDAVLDGSLLLPRAAMLVVGTPCYRPVGFSEARMLGEYTGLD